MSPAQTSSAAAGVPAKRAAKPKTAAATAQLPPEIFDAKVNVPLIHQVVVAQEAAARQGTHSTKRAARCAAVAEALPAEGHRPRSAGFHPGPAVRGRRRRARPASALV